MDLGYLKELGLSGGQIAVYSAILELGISTLNKIQEKTGIERRNIYDILNKLIEKGLIAYTTEKGKRTYQCTPPNKLLEEIKKKRKNLDELEKQLPSVTTLFNATKPEVRAEVFRGTEALKALLEDFLNYKESYWIGGNSGVYNTPLKDWFNHWMKRRVEKKHVMYDLVDYGTWLDGLEPNKLEEHKKNFYHYSTLPPQLSSPLVTVVHGNKVAQILWMKKPFAFVMESKDVKENYTKYFHYFWEQNIKIYKGKEGLLVVLKGIIEEGKKRQASYGYGSHDDPYLKFAKKELFEFFKEKEKYNIKERLIFSEGFKSPNPTAEIKYLPKGFISPLRVVIFGKKMGISAFSKKDITTLIIEDEKIVEAHIAYFNSLWKIAKEK